MMNASLIAGQVVILAAIVAAAGAVIAAFVSSSRQMQAALASANVAYEALEHNRTESEKRREIEATQILRAAVLSVSERELQQIQKIREASIELLTLIQLREHDPNLKGEDTRRILVLIETICFLVPPNTSLGEWVNIDVGKLYSLFNGGNEPWKTDTLFFSRVKMNLLLATASEESRIREQMLTGEYIKRKLDPYTYQQSSQRDQTTHKT